jgi:methylated-DNA-protein-cysteine methyltransferase-like protein
MKNSPPKGLHQRIYDVVAQIPEGRVATYGQVARIAGIPRHARLVGYALHALPRGTLVPWQRVVNTKGEISARGGNEIVQRILLEREGVRFGPRGRIALAKFQWKRGRSRAAPRAGGELKLSARRRSSPRRDPDR